MDKNIMPSLEEIYPERTAYVKGMEEYLQKLKEEGEDNKRE